MNNETKKKIAVVMLAAAGFIFGQGLFAAGAPEKGTGEIVEKEYNPGYFDSLTISGIENYRVVMSGQSGVKVKADGNIIGDVVVDQRGSSVSIVLPDACGYNPSVLEAVVYVSSLDELRIGAKSSGILTGVPMPDDIKIEVTDGSELRIESLLADRADIEVSVGSVLSGRIDADALSVRVYSSAVDLSGRAESLSCFSDAGNISMEEFYVETALLDFHNESVGSCDLRDSDMGGSSPSTTVKLYDESVLTLKAEGSVDDYVYDDSELN